MVDINKTSYDTFTIKIGVGVLYYSSNNNFLSYPLNNQGSPTLKIFETLRYEVFEYHPGANAGKEILTNITTV